MVHVKKQNNFFFFFQNPNTRLISVAMWASPGVVALVVGFTEVWDARCGRGGWFKTRPSRCCCCCFIGKEASWSGAARCSHVAALKSKEGPPLPPPPTSEAGTLLTGGLARPPAEGWLRTAQPSQGSGCPPPHRCLRGSALHHGQSAWPRMGFDKPRGKSFRPAIHD